MFCVVIEEIRAKLREVASEYSPELRADQLVDVDRIAFHISLVLENTSAGSVCDIGGGVGLFSVGCAAMGLSSTLVDDFGDAVNIREGCGVLELHQRFGVRIIARDVIADGLEFPPDSFDAITSFDSMEHWHHSPKRLLHGLAGCLKPGGMLLIGAPNCVNLRKRITVPFGRGNWSSMQAWYEAETFRQHVREPDVDDLLYIARDLGLSDISVFGRNWLGYRSASRLTRAMTALVDLPIRLRPSLCADIYVMGFKEKRAG